MAQLTGVRHTYDDTVRREDLLDRIVDISPEKNYLTTILGSVDVSQTLHEWSEYFISRDSSNDKSIEGDENTFADLPQPVRKNNIAQIIKKVFAVSRTDVKVNKVSPKDAYARELGVAMRRWKNSSEYAVIRGTKASGASGVAREMGGIITFTQSDGAYTVRASGTSLSENEFSDIMEASWNSTDEFLVDLILTTGTRKRDFAKFFTTSTPKTIPADDKRLVQALEVIESDYGNLVELRAHKDIPTDSLLAMRKDLVKIGYLDNPIHVPNGVTGDNTKGHVVGELTVQVDTARAFAYRAGYNL